MFRKETPVILTASPVERVPVTLAISFLIAQFSVLDYNIIEISFAFRRSAWEIQFYERGIALARKLGTASSGPPN